MRLVNPTFRFMVAAFLLGSFLPVAQAADTDLVVRPWKFLIGGGFTPVVGGLNSVLTSGWNFSMGTEYNFKKRMGVRLEYQNNHLGVEDSVLKRFSTQIGDKETDGTTHVWSVTLSPTWRFELGQRVGAYLIGGGGYYHVNSQVTTPGVAFQPGYCDPYWGCWPGGFVEGHYIVGEHKDDTGGINAGVGISFDLRPDVQFYMESRYHYIFLHGPDLQIMPFTAGFRFG